MRLLVHVVGTLLQEKQETDTFRKKKHFRPWGDEVYKKELFQQGQSS